MKLDERFIKHVVVNASMLNENGHFTFSSCQQLMIDATEKHMMLNHVDVPYLIEHHGISWVLLSMTVEFCRPVRPGEGLRAGFAGSSRSGLIFRRDVEVLDETGSTVMMGALFFAVLNIATRKICRDEETLRRLNVTEGKRLFEAESRADYDASRFHEVHTRRVYPSWLDELGHVNNRRYGEMAYDAFSEEYRKKLGALAHYEIYFMHELHAGDVVSVRSREEGCRVEIIGISENDGYESFFIRCIFKDSPDRCMR